MKQRPWFLALILLTIFLATTEYKYGWDDQHLEIPLLKSLIDPTLYQGDYYVESLKKNFPSFFYPLLSRFITVEQIPEAYFYLYIVSRYFLLFWMYKIWLLLTQRRFYAFACVLTFILLLRVEEFSYRTFSHQEFALAFIFAGIYYFFKERFVKSAAILGFAANFNAIYSLFPILYLGFYLLWQIHRYGLKTFIKTSFAFILFAFPFIVWVIKMKLNPGNKIVANYEEWFTLAIASCPWNFMFSHKSWAEITKDFYSFWAATGGYIYLLLLFLINLFFNKIFQRNKKVIAINIVGFFLLILCLVFTEIYPNRFLIDLNLIRNAQYLSWILTGYLTILVLTKLEEGIALQSLIVVILFALLRVQGTIAFFALGMMSIILICARGLTLRRKFSLRQIKIFNVLFIAILSAGCLYMIYDGFQKQIFRQYLYITMWSILAVSIINFTICLFLRNQRLKLFFHRGFIVIVFMAFFGQFVYYYIQYLKDYSNETGMWKFRKDWERMEYVVKYNTPKNAIVLIPYDTTMCGFRIFSERKVLVSYRDSGIIGFDYAALLEWQQRIKDVEGFKVKIGDLGTALENAIFKYKVNYIVFMKYAKPVKEIKILKQIAETELFSLYKVLVNPV